MYVQKIRRVTNDNFHNMDTGIKWFKDALYLTYRTGDAHVCPQGRLVVQRSRDGGKNFDIVHVARGAVDTRDAHLLKDENRLYVVGFESAGINISGTSWTEDGLHWSPWTRFTGADGWWLWHPEYYNGKYYCAGYGNWDRLNSTSLAWFESDNMIDWRQMRIVHEGADHPNEASLDFLSDGTAILLSRRELASKKPLLMRSAPPYDHWTKTELDVALAGLAVWHVGDDIYFAGRWYPQERRHVAHLAAFKLVNEQPVLQVVFPSGPGYDHSYPSVAPFPDNPNHFTMAYYSNHNMPPNPAANQWCHPDIYVADVLFVPEFIREWKVSEFIPTTNGFTDAACPTDAEMDGWSTVTANPDDAPLLPGFVDLKDKIAGRSGMVYLAADIDAGMTDVCMLHMGYDGPIRIWLNGQLLGDCVSTGPAEPDMHAAPIMTRHGINRLVFALDTNGGTASGMMARYEAG